MPRILRIINRLNLGGPTYNVAYLTRHLAPEFETLLVSGQIDDTEASSMHILESLNITPQYIQNMHREISLLKDYKGYREIRQIIKEFKPDIVHTHAAKAGTLGRLAASHAGVPVRLHTFHGHVFHSYFGKAKTRLFIEIERYLARISSAVVAISDTQKRELAHEFKIAPENKIAVVHNGFDLQRFTQNQDELRQRFRTKYHLADDEIAIGIIGRLVPIKNHDLFLNAIARLSQLTQKRVRALMIGDGEDRQKIEALNRTLGLPILINEEKPNPENRVSVTYTSWITDIERATAGLDIVALSSLNEGTPVSLIEAQAAARAIVSTRVGGVADIMPDGVAGLLSPSAEVEPFAQNLFRLVEDDALRQRMGQAGRDFVLDRFSYQALCGNMAALYRRLLKESKR